MAHFWGLPGAPALASMWGTADGFVPTRRTAVLIPTPKGNEGPRLPSSGSGPLAWARHTSRSTFPNSGGREYSLPMDWVTLVVIAGVVVLWIVGVTLWRRFGSRFARTKSTDAAAAGDSEVRDERLRAEQRLRDEHQHGQPGFNIDNPS